MHLLAYNLLRSLMWQSAQQSQVLPLRMSLQGARQQFNQFRRSWLRQPPKTVVASTQPCSMSSVINSFPCVLIGQNRESPKEDPRVFPECSNLAPSSKLSWSFDIASVSAALEFLPPSHYMLVTYIILGWLLSFERWFVWLMVVVGVLMIIAALSTLVKIKDGLTGLLKSRKHFLRCCCSCFIELRYHLHTSHICLCLVAVNILARLDA